MVLLYEQRMLCKSYLANSAIKACIQSVLLGIASQACVRWQLRLLTSTLWHKHLQHNGVSKAAATMAHAKVI